MPRGAAADAPGRQGPDRVRPRRCRTAVPPAARRPGGAPLPGAAGSRPGLPAPARRRGVHLHRGTAAAPGPGRSAGGGRGDHRTAGGRRVRAGGVRLACRAGPGAGAGAAARGGPSRAGGAAGRHGRRADGGRDARTRPARGRVATRQGADRGAGDPGRHAAGLDLAAGRPGAGLGRALPLRGSTRLPRELYGMWRGRGKGGRPAAARPGTPAAASPAPGGGGPAADGHLHLAHRAFTAGPRDRLVIAGVLDATTTADFAHDAVVNRVLPHDARQVAERTDPDVLVVQLSACLAGPWAHTGTGTAPDLDRRLAELLATVHALGRTAVLWRDAPPPPRRGWPRSPGTPCSTGTPGCSRPGWTRRRWTAPTCGRSSPPGPPGSGCRSSPGSPGRRTRWTPGGWPCWPTRVTDPRCHAWSRR